MKINFTALFALLTCTAFVHSSQRDLKGSVSPRPEVLEKKESTPRLYKVEDELVKLNTALENHAKQLEAFALQDHSNAEQFTQLQSAIHLSEQQIKDLKTLFEESLDIAKGRTLTPSQAEAHAFTDEVLTSIDTRLQVLQERTTKHAEWWEFLHRPETGVLAQTTEQSARVQELCFQLSQLTESAEDGQDRSPLNLPTLVNRVKDQDGRLRELTDQLTTITSKTTGNNSELLGLIAEHTQALAKIEAIFKPVDGQPVDANLAPLCAEIAALKKINADAQIAAQQAQAQRKKLMQRDLYILAGLAITSATYYGARHTQRGQEMTQTAIDSVKSLWSLLRKPFAGLVAGAAVTAPVVLDAISNSAQQAEPESIITHADQAPENIVTHEELHEDPAVDLPVTE